MNKENENRIGIIGGGIAGMVAAYKLGKLGLQVTLIEANHQLGGLASSFLFDGEFIELYYHFICKADYDYFDLLEELEISDKLEWNVGITSFFHDGYLYRFAIPLDLIRFRPISLISRIRFGLNIIQDRFRHHWEKLDHLPARDWLISQIGKSAYDVIWDPLLRIKFGTYHDKISAAWVWHRIHRVAISRDKIWQPERLGYLIGGTQTLVTELSRKLEGMSNVTILLNKFVSKINSSNQAVKSILLNDGQVIPCSSLISTIPLNKLKTIVDDSDFREELDQFNYIGVVCGLLKLKKPVTESFWVNINDQRIPFNGIIEYTNLNDRLRKEHAAHYIYVPYYAPPSDPWFEYSDEELMEIFISGLKLINQNFNESWITASNIVKSSVAQAICGVGFKDKMLPMASQIEGLFITDSTLYYPEDRTISASIRLGSQAVELVKHREKYDVQK